MTKVYVVTSGSYSDYRIRAIFSSSALAEAWIKSWHGSTDINEKVEEYILDSEPAPKLCYLVYMDKKGNVEEIDLREMDEYTDFGFSYFTFSKLGQDEKALAWYVDTLDEKRAIKVVNEKRAQIIALDIWGNDEAVEERVK